MNHTRIKKSFFFIFSMILFSKREKNDLKKFIAERPKFADAEQTFSEEELQLMKSENMGEKIW